MSVVKLFLSNCYSYSFPPVLTKLGTHVLCASMLGPVSAWVGDCLWTGKPPRRRTRYYPGLLNLSPPSVVRLERVPDKSWESIQAYRVIHHPVSVVSQCSLNACVSDWLAEISADLREAVAHQRRFVTMSLQTHILYFFTLRLANSVTLS